MCVGLCRHIEKRPCKATGKPAEQGEYSFFPLWPSVDIDRIAQRRIEGRKIKLMEMRAVFALCHEDAAPVGVLLVQPVGPAGLELVDFSAVPVEERQRELPADRLLKELRYAENRKIRPDELVEVEQGRIVQGIVYATGEDAGHIFGHGHAFAVHNDPRPGAVRCLLPLRTGFSFRVEHDAVGTDLADHFRHAGVVVFPAGTLVPGVVANEKAGPQAAAVFGLFPQGRETAGKVAQEIPLVALVEPQHRPIRPYPDDIGAAEQGFHAL